MFGFDATVLSQFGQGDLIGAFTQDGRCAGIIAVDNVVNSQVLIAFANDPLSDSNDGFESDELVTFRVFRSSTNADLFLDVTYSPQSPSVGYFTHNGISTIENIEFKTSSIGNNNMGNTDVQLQIYPNPTSGLVNITLKSEKQIAGDISITNINGQIVFTTSFDQSASAEKMKVDLTELPRGVYYIRITSDWFTKIEKIVLD